METQSIRIDNKQRQLLLFFAILILTVGVLAYLFLPEQIDWVRTYRPATRLLLSGHSPYQLPSFFNPPWVLLPLVPLALLPDQLGATVLFVLNLAAWIYTAYRMGAKGLGIAAVVLSFPVFFCVLFGQIDWMLAVSLLLPHPIGLFFILAKPQIGLPIALFWLVTEWRKNGIVKAVSMFLPVSLAFLLSFLGFGFWPLMNNSSNLSQAPYNISFWPYAVPMGLVLLSLALRYAKQNFALLSSTSFSPYVGPHSWSLTILGLIPYNRELIIASISSWVFFLAKLI